MTMTSPEPEWFKYDAAHGDPAPVVQAGVEALHGSGSCVVVPMLIDTGADLTLIPTHVVDQLHLVVEPESNVVLEAFDGSRTTRPVVRARLHIGRFKFPGIFVVDHGQVGIVGRNVLKHLRVLLDGPSARWRFVSPGSL